jgi:hypothetical protein
MSIKHLVIPDVQQKPGGCTKHLTWAGMYAVEKQPDVIICIGDFWDMPSLSVYDVGKKGFEGRKYTDDIAAGRKAMDAFLAPIIAFNKKAKESKKKRYRPRLVFTLGNHEQRIERAIESDRKLEGLLSYDDFELEKDGWELYDYLEPVVVDGVAYSHFFTSGIMGRPVSSARLMLNKKHMSCVMGHVQDRDIAFAKRADGKPMTGIFCGIFYQHDEDYLNPQTNGSWSGVWMLHDVQDGSFDEMPVSINYLEKRYGAS